MTQRRLPHRKEIIERASRITINEEVLVSSFGSSQKYKAFCKNVSASGFLLEDAKLPFQLNSLVELHIHSIDLKKTLKLAGKIIRIDPGEDDKKQFGVQFSFLDHHELAIWGDFIAIKQKNLEQ